jgi:sterol desaturase/sphingolipid hydroxylase (fatty acid hydroxylase superfamily)
MIQWLQLEARASWPLFVAAFLALAIWESRAPRREMTRPLGRRWTAHALLFAISVVISTLLRRLSPLAVAAAVVGNRYGLLNKAAIPWAVRFVLTLAALDLMRYLVHRAMHSTQLWRLHQVHHSDSDFDVSTGTRNHPLEIIVAEGAVLAVIALLAPPLSAVFAYELLAQASSFFTHANVAIPAAIERPLRWVLVTPDMHRVHHSTEVAEQFSNFSEVFPFWDRLFGTYRAQPSRGHQHMTLGLAEMQDERSLALGRMLSQPFRKLESPNAASAAQGR